MPRQQMIKFRKTLNRGEFPQLNKENKKPASNNILNGEKPDALP